MIEPGAGPPPPPGRPSAAGVGTRSHRSWIWSGATLIVVGVVAVVVWIVYGVVSIDSTVDEMVRAREGAVTSFSLDGPRSWTVYVEPQSAGMSGLRFGIHDSVGERIEMQPYGGDVSYSVTGHSGRAVATVALAPGEYQLVVDGSGTRWVAIGPSIGGRIVRLLVGGLLLGVPLIGGGATIAIVGALRQSRARNRAAGTPPSSAWSSGEWSARGR